MLYLSEPGFEIHSFWTVADNSDYDDIWDLIFEEEGIVPEEDDVFDGVLEDILNEFNSMTDQEYYDKYYGENK